MLRSIFLNISLYIFNINNIINKNGQPKLSVTACRKTLFFGKVWLLRKKAEWRFLRPKAYKGTSMGEKTSNKRKFKRRDAGIPPYSFGILTERRVADPCIYFVYVSATLSTVKGDVRLNIPFCFYAVSSSVSATS